MFGMGLLASNSIKTNVGDCLRDIYLHKHYYYEE
jgi:hypothetical protein